MHSYCLCLAIVVTGRNGSCIQAAEKAKRELDGLAATEVSLPFITADAEGPKHLNIRLTKAKFENLVDHLVQKTLGTIVCLSENICTYTNPCICAWQDLARPA